MPQTVSAPQMLHRIGESHRVSLAVKWIPAINGGMTKVARLVLLVIPAADAKAEASRGPLGTTLNTKRSGQPVCSVADSGQSIVAPEVFPWASGLRFCWRCCRSFLLVAPGWLGRKLTVRR